MTATPAVLPGLVAAPSHPDAATTTAFLAPYERPATLPNDTFFSLPVFTTAICVTSNHDRSVPRLSLALNDLADFLLGLRTNISMTRPKTRSRSTAASVFSPQLSLVMATDSYVTRRVVAALIRQKGEPTSFAGLPDTEPATIPAAMRANPLIRWVRDDEDVEAALRTANTWGFLLENHHLEYPCAELRVYDPQSGVENTFLPFVLPPSCGGACYSTMWLPDALHSTIEPDNAYPLLGPVYLFFRRGLDCDTGHQLSAWLRNLFFDETTTDVVSAQFFLLCPHQRSRVISTLYSHFTEYAEAAAAGTTTGFCSADVVMEGFRPAELELPFAFWMREWATTHPDGGLLMTEEHHEDANEETEEVHTFNSQSTVPTAAEL